MFPFVGQFLSNFHRTGAVLPSWPGLARAMTRSLEQAPGPKRILEVGPGTGSFTGRILSSMNEGDSLHLVEINPIFCRRLEARHLQPFRARHPRTELRLHCGPIESVPLEGTFDFIVCGLPFGNFPPAMARSIFRRLLGLVAEGGELAYFEYMALRTIFAPLAGAAGRSRLRRLNAMGKTLRRRHAGRRELVMMNLPPAYAVRLVR